MNCIYLTIRSKKYEKYKFCRLKKKTINDDCKKCLEKQFRKYKDIKKKSNKLSKLERERDKGTTKKGICEYCGCYSERLDPHEVFGGSNRQRSIKNKFVKLICRNCHDDEEVIKELRKKVQREYEEKHSREEFIELIGKSYLD